MLNLPEITTPTFLDLLADDVVDDVLAASVSMNYSDGQLIHTRGELKPGLSIVRAGAVHVGVNGIDGTFVMVASLGPGECFGEFTLFTDLPRTHDVSSVGESEVYQLSKVSFEKLHRKHAGIAHALLNTTLTRTHLLLEMLDAIRRLPILERTAKTLLSMSYSLGGSVLRSRQDQLAHTLGVTRASLSKALKQLSQLGLIEVGYGKITITNQSNLMKWVQLNCGTPL